jgi:hypothetical protein
MDKFEVSTGAFLRACFILQISYKIFLAVALCGCMMSKILDTNFLNYNYDWSLEEKLPKRACTSQNGSKIGPARPKSPL